MANVQSNGNLRHFKEFAGRSELNPVFPSGALKLPADDFVSLLLRFVVGGNFPEGYRLQTPRRESQALAECSLQTEEGQARAGASGWESAYPLMVTAG